MLQPCVPSNASPRVAVTELTTRVLQEHSGNRQHSDLKFTQSYKVLLSENTHPRHITRPTHQSYRPSHAPFRSGFARPSYARSHHPTTAEKDDRARRLLRRLNASEQYAKYRAKGSKDDKNEEKKWPDHLEQAFFRALVEYPPMGRKKLLFKDKQRGRNELITDWIQMATGLKRDRKQVSSHIQVLKPFVQDDPVIMAHLSFAGNGEHVAPQKFMPAYYSQQLHGRGPSSYPVQAPPQSIRHSGGRQIHSLPTLENIGGEQGRLRDTPDVFEPVDFEMFVQRKLSAAESSHDEVERLHTYTKQISQPWEADEFFSDWNDITRSHPNLPALHSHRPIDCNVIAAQASLALHSGPWKDKDGLPVGSGGIELGISFHCRTGELPRPFEVICQNHFYERGKLSENSTHAHAILDSTSNNDIQVMFGSNFWVKALSAKHKEACESGPEGGSAFVSSINATQDIFIKTATGTERVMLIHWSFRQSTGGLGRTSWKRIVMPPSTTSAQYASPSKAIPADTPFNFNDDPIPNLTSLGVPPTLQSPFEYNSGTGPEPTSAIWPAPISDASGLSLIHASSTDVDMTNAFDFTGGHMDITYDPDLNLDSFDTSAFNFDATTDDFAADPVLQDYSQSWMGGGYTDSFDSAQQSFAEDSFQASAAIESQGSRVFPTYGVFDPQMYGVEHESQAFGGAGQDAVKDEAVMAAVTEFATQASCDIGIESQEAAQ